MALPSDHLLHDVCNADQPEPALFCSPLEVADAPESAARIFVRHAVEGAAAAFVVLVLFGGLALAAWRWWP